MQGQFVTGDNWQADVNADGKINILGLIFVRNRLNTMCPEWRGFGRKCRPAVANRLTDNPQGASPLTWPCASLISPGCDRVVTIRTTALQNHQADATIAIEVTGFPQRPRSGTNGQKSLPGLRPGIWT